MFDPQAPGAVFVLAIGKARQHSLLQQAENRRLLAKPQPERPRLQRRLLLSIGDALVAWGFWLKARYQSDLGAG
jgi:hypothetical protein